MTRSVLLSSAALGILALLPAPAAAQCVAGGDVDNSTLTCTGDSAPVTSAVDALAVTVETGATVFAPSGRAMFLSGADQSVTNLGTIEAGSDEAIRSRGPGFTVDNSGTIRAGDRAIRLQQNAEGFTLINREDGEIFSRRQAIRADNELRLQGITIENHGLIDSAEGRAIQSRGPGTRVINFGTLIGGEEVVEGREDFYLENHGTIRIRDAEEADDGVQFSSGELHNWGLIEGTDDGVDIDQGLIHNRAGGVIRSRAFPGDRDNGGIDADALLQIEGVPDAEQEQAGLLTIINEGLIEGPRAVTVQIDRDIPGEPDVIRTGAIDIVNSGTLRGTGGIAVDFAPEMEESSLTLFGDSLIFGDVLLTDSDDTLTIGALTSGVLINSVFDGRGGDNAVLFDGYAIEDLKLFDSRSAVVRVALMTQGGLARGRFLNFDSWTIGDVTYTTAELGRIAPIPLPGALPLMLGALGLVAAVRGARRR